jgi:hypothetical protein
VWRSDSRSTVAFAPDCPSCGMPMEVIDRFTLKGVPAPTEHIKAQCVLGHWFTIPTEPIAPTDPELRRRPASLSQEQEVSHVHDVGI